MTRANKDLLRQLVDKYSLTEVLHQLAELCYELDSEECEKGENSGVWGRMGDELEELSSKCGC